ncbi:MAG: hypothetical protein M1540_03015 [Candidatus Bathyarchaeota archaeon]|nr:hypothetical protein [Candidatus Bathyarchaeota archaeon]
MQSAVGPLLLLTSSAMFSCIVIGFAVGVSVQTLQDPQTLAQEQFNRLELALNQSSGWFNQTYPPQTPNPQPPTQNETSPSP